MFRSILCFMALLVVCAGCKSKTDDKAKEATITSVDTKKGTVAVKLHNDGRDVDKTFRLAEKVEYLDSTGKVVAEDIFTSGDMVLIFESEGTITKMKKKDTLAAKQPDSTNKSDKPIVAKKPDATDKSDKPIVAQKPDATDKSDKPIVAQKPDATDNSDKEAKIANETFIRAADQINLAEIKLGKVAEEHAGNDAVKKYGERGVRDHSLMNKELREITSKKGIKLADGLDQKHQMLVDDLSKLKGAEFDKAYTKDMVAGHEDAIKQFEIEVKSGQDSDVKAWAEKCLPMLREHLKLAKATIKDVNGK